ncbi:MAG: hypothetical protein CVU57_07870 [Deltaproteobacteria bacterium HGW-Deltaproteobacteria-15]|nr:MAG: hypothetical protein CVU57_07870 [Deltaproteobacteria bacterium HGW-Deltaproteobacteria-15]
MNLNHERREEMKRVLLTILAGTAFALWSIVPLVYSQGFIIHEEAVDPNHKYMSGGVGVEERNAMEAQSAKGYDLKLVFAITPGNYLSFIDVRINDQSGKQVLSAQSNGPWFYADLPKGSYTVVADYEGNQKSQKVTVDGSLKQVVFHWKQDLAGEPKAGASERKQAVTGAAKTERPNRSTEK